MKQIISFILCWTGFFSLTGQETFSKLYELDASLGVNFTKDMEVLNGKIYVLSEQGCDSDTGSSSCTLLARMSSDGELEKVARIDSILSFTSGKNRLEVGLNGELFLSGHKQGDNYRNTFLYRMNADLETKEITAYRGPISGSYIENSGVAVIDSFLYIYGGVRNRSEYPDSAEIIKLDYLGNEIWRKYYTIGDSDIEVNSLQATPDNNLAFILFHKSAPGAGGLPSGYQILTVDLSGDTISTYRYNDLYNYPNRLLVSSDHSYYFSSRRDPESNRETSVGRINKLNSDMDSIEWSLIPPNDPLIDGRFFKMSDYIEAENGDIVACGMAREDSDNEIPGTGSDKHTTWNGFMIRVTPAGELVWLRIYRNPNDFVSDEYGRFRPSILTKVIETETGHFIAAGDVSITGYKQKIPANDPDKEKYHTWLLKVDENGCLDGYPCDDEIIRIEYQTKDYSERLWNIGSEWTYETVEFLGAGNNIIDFRTFRITDTVTTGGRLKYVINNIDTFYNEHSKVFFWDHDLESYEMYFDFDETNQYTIRYWDMFRNEEHIATVEIDSVSQRIIAGDTIGVQHVNVFNSGTIDPYDVEIYEGIGTSEFDLKFELGCGLCDYNPITTKLRCFSNDTLLYNFVDYPCDSTWYIISGTSEILSEKISIYPNPTDKDLYIEGIEKDVEYQLYNSTGILIEVGKTKSNKISLPAAYKGLLSIKLHIDEHRVTKRIIKLE